MQKTVADTMKGSAIHKVWVGNYRETASDRFTTRMIDRLFASLGLPKGAAVLDAGCGTGTNSHRLAAKGFRVTGVDLSGFALDEARRRGEGPDFRQGDLTALDLDNGSFDCVFCCGVLMHIPDFEQAIGESGPGVEARRLPYPHRNQCRRAGNARLPDLLEAGKAARARGQEGQPARNWSRRKKARWSHARCGCPG